MNGREHWEIINLMNHKAVPQNIKNRTVIQSISSTYEYLTEENENDTSKNTFLLLFTAVLFTIVTPRYGSNLSVLT